MSLVHWILILNLWVLKATSLQAGSRVVLREIGHNIVGDSDHKDYTVELNATNFDAVLKDTPATYAIVEFFAHWLVLFSFLRCHCFKGLSFDLSRKYKIMLKVYSFVITVDQGRKSMCLYL